MADKKLNKNLRDAQKAKRDEFYTQLQDIEREMAHYSKHFKDAVVFCNCDDETSNFWNFFCLNFDLLGLKGLVSTHYDTEKPSYKLEITRDNRHLVKTALKQNGDFRSEECVEILKSCDIVITNPPFSLFREYIAQLVEYGKKFLVIGNMNAVTYKEVFKLFMESKIWLGLGFKTGASYFTSPYLDTFSDSAVDKERGLVKFGNIRWFTNLDYKARHEDLILYRTYNPEDYPKYDNYDAINVDKTKDIPCDYSGPMGVPISFLDKWNPEQFEILGLDRYIDGNKTPNKRFFISGKEIYARIVIKNPSQKP